jgi:hypothetical protein
MRTITAFFLTALLLAGLSSAFGGEFWKDKDYRQWSLQQCNKMLEDSPWAQPYTEVMIANSTSSLTAAIGLAPPGAEGQPYVRYIYQLFSALPIRQALVRKMQIAEKYESLSAIQRQAFDKRTEEILAPINYNDKIVVKVQYSTNSFRGPLERFWKNEVNFGIISHIVYLSRAKGRDVPLLEYEPPSGGQNELTLVFPRQHEGGPVLTPQDKYLELKGFPNWVKGAEDQGRQTMFLPNMTGGGKVYFNVKKMLINGEVAY